MQREIKFQYVFHHKKDGDYQYEVFTLDRIERGEAFEYTKYMKADGYMLVNRRQYTGLKDKNGKEIYEKDIIKDSFGDRIGMIKYNVYTASFEIAEYDGIHLLSADNGEKFFEVIGNVFEHPNLLQEEIK